MTRKPRAPHPSWRKDWPPGSVVLGYTKRGKPIYIPADMRALGCHIIGLPGQGKSRAAEAMLRQDILELDGVPRGAALLDPHGTLFGSVLRWYATHGLHRVRRIRVLDPSDPNVVFHLNPLRCRPGVDPAVVASAVTNAVLRVWGGDATATPQLRTTLKHTFYSLCELGLPLTRAADLLDLTDESGLRAYAAAHGSNPVTRQFWRELSALRLPQREERVGSATRRLTEFLLPARVRAIFSDADRALDWRQAMDDGEIVLVNLAFDSGRLSEDEAQVIGVMMLAEIFLSCQGRPEGSLPFYLYVDECHRFLTEDMAKVIVEGRKFGVHAGALIHQTIGQLREAGDFVFSAVMACRTKIVFGGFEPDDAEHMARSVFRGQLDVQRDKERFRKPVVVGQELAWLLSETDSHGSARAEGTNWAASESVARTSSSTTSWGTTRSASVTSSAARTRSRSVSRSLATTQSASRSEQWSHTDQRSASTSSSDTRSSSATQSVGLTQDFVDWYDRPRLDRWRWPQREATINDMESETRGTAITASRSASSAASDSFGGARSAGEAMTKGVAEVTGEAETRGTARTSGVAETVGRASSAGVTRSVSRSQGGSTTHTASEQYTRGRSQAYRSVFEVLPGQSYTLEELLHLASVTIANLPQGEAVVKIGRRPSARVKIVRVADGVARPEHVARVTAALAAETPYVTPLAPPPPAEPSRQIPVLRVVPTDGEAEKPPLGPKPVEDGWG